MAARLAFATETAYVQHMPTFEVKRQLPAFLFALHRDPPDHTRVAWKNTRTEPAAERTERRAKSQRRAGGLRSYAAVLDVFVRTLGGNLRSKWLQLQTRLVRGARNAAGVQRRLERAMRSQPYIYTVDDVGFSPAKFRFSSLMCASRDALVSLQTADEIVSGTSSICFE